MGKYTAYPEYKDSGVEWLGKVPTHWELVRNIGLFEERNEKGSPDAELLAVTILYGVLKQSDLAEITDRKNTASDDKSNYKLVREGDLVYNKMRMWQGAIGISPQDGIVSPAYIVLKPSTEINNRFFFYQFKTPGFISESGRFSYGLCDDMNSLRYKDFRSIYSIVPPQEEQTQIAAFLDHETAKIDRLIAKQEELIALLQEKRQAVISHAVTKGLDPNAPMKDSGVEWLGEVPAHWEVKKIKHITKSIEQGWSPQCESEPANGDAWGVLKVGCVNGGVFNSAENKKLPETMAPRPDYALKAGDLLISRANTKDLVGSAAVVQHDHPNLMLCDKLYRLRLIDSVIPHWVAFYLGTSNARERIELEATGASHSMQNIGQDTIKDIHCPVPPKGEADSILNCLSSKLSSLRNVEKKASTAIALLQERHTALISAAVTGKIDVREWGREVQA
ncbi:restriction endonuclease subunit S [Oceanidesulfovibrio indonesiensis]|uniref:Restriction endonuclease subunit S n=1 Tax=Oceanidesulfovibrio indonesiensis TaxID=54767 RepID=A0A7M3ME53_9BACT|nr:restriction endonuclease subunit S [Oceanidesulfovibrio indonesiensis]TVM17096.1 restriction endonuclease subunit S [Oceanidesulfovibrio indonesiensis]